MLSYNLEVFEKSGLRVETFYMFCYSGWRVRVAKFERVLSPVFEVTDERFRLGLAGSTGEEKVLAAWAQLKRGRVERRRPGAW